MMMRSMMMRSMGWFLPAPGPASSGATAPTAAQSLAAEDLNRDDSFF
jgi:hypothetical protein